MGAAARADNAQGRQRSPQLGWRARGWSHPGTGAGEARPHPPQHRLEARQHQVWRGWKADGSRSTPPHQAPAHAAGLRGRGGAAEPGPRASVAPPRRTP